MTKDDNVRVKGVNMDWFQVLAIAGSIIAACWYMHRENVKMHLENAKEMKDFHGRLCTLKERYLQMMQRLLEKKGE
jgi:hypothetical protein